MELWNFILDKSFEKVEAIQLNTLWKNNPHDVGILVCEHVVNIPFDIITPPYDVSLKETNGFS